MPTNLSRGPMPLPPPPGVLGAIQAAPVGPSAELVQQVERPGPTRINASGYRDAIPTPSELPAPQYDKSFDPLPRTDWENLRQYKTFAERNPQVYAELQDTIKAPGFRDYMLMALANNGMPVAGAILNEKRARRAAIIENAESLARIEHLDQQSLGENVGAWRDAVSGSLEVNNTAYDREYKRQAAGSERAQAYQSIANAAKADEEAETERQMRDPRIQTEQEQADAYRANQAQSYASARSSDATAANTTADTEREGEMWAAQKPYIGDMAQYEERKAEGESRKAQADANLSEWTVENPVARVSKVTTDDYIDRELAKRYVDEAGDLDRQVAELNQAIDTGVKKNEDGTFSKYPEKDRAEGGPLQTLRAEKQTRAANIRSELGKLRKQTVAAPGGEQAQVGSQKIMSDLVGRYTDPADQKEAEAQIKRLMDRGMSIQQIYDAYTNPAE